MEDQQILGLLEATTLIEDLLSPILLVGPGALISNNFEWLMKFREGSSAFNKKNFDSAAEIFVELDISLPRNDRIITPARINETFCWLQVGKFAEYIEKYEPMLLTKAKPLGVVLWNLAYAYHRQGNDQNAELSLKRWITNPSLQFLGKGYLMLAVLQSGLGRKFDAADSFNHAWRVDKKFCQRTIEKYIGVEQTQTLLGIKTEPAKRSVRQREIVAKTEVIAELEKLLIPRPPERYTQLAHQLSEFEYQNGYIVALERFGDGDLEEFLKLIETLIKGAKESTGLFWAKAACLAAQRDWNGTAEILQEHVTDPSTTGGVLWNATCAYFHLGSYPAALETMLACTEREFKTSTVAHVVKALLAHLNGRSDLRNVAVREALSLSPIQLVYHIEILRKIGVDVEGLPSARTVISPHIEDSEMQKKYDRCVVRAKQLLNQGKRLRAAENFSQLAPQSFTDVKEIGDTTFPPLILPTCPAELYDYKEIFLAGVVAFRRKGYEEAVEKFEDLYSKTDRSYPAAVNLAASLIVTGKFSRAVDILSSTIRERLQGGASAIRNLISAFIRSEKYEEAFPWFSKLLEVSRQEHFNFVQTAYVANVLGRKEDVATALYNACTMNASEPSILLKGSAIKACLEVKDNDRAFTLVRYFVKETPLPFVVAGSTRPIVSAEDCKTYSDMNRQYLIFIRRRDKRASLAYFEAVHSARQRDYSSLVDPKSVDGLFSACMYYGRSLFENEEIDQAHETLRQAHGVLIEHSDMFSLKELSKRYYGLSNLYFERKHYFWALDLAERGIEADTTNRELQKLQREVEGKISQIPEKAREASKELAEMPVESLKSKEEFLGLFPKINQLIQSMLMNDLASKKVIDQFTKLVNRVLKVDGLPIQKRKVEISELRGLTSKVEKEISLDLPKAFISSLLPVLKRIKKTLDEVQALSVFPEFRLEIQPVCYYRENEALLVFKLRNHGSADILKLQMRVESETPEIWSPAIEEQSYEVVKKDQSIWIDWPIHLDFSPASEAEITPTLTVRFTGGSLRGEVVEEKLLDQRTRLLPFVDISVNYPVLALSPAESPRLYGRENLLRTMMNSLTPSGQNVIPFLEGVRKVGKTSILYFLASRVSNSGGLLPVYVNFDTEWSNPFRLLASRITDEACRKFNVEPEEINVIADRDQFDFFLNKVLNKTKLTRVLLLLDEFHTVIDRIERRAVPDSFLGDLRDLYMSPGRKVAVVFADWHLIDELKARVPAQLWTDFARQRVTFLSESDAREAVRAPAEGSLLRLEGETVANIYYYTNGYPWHIQWICSELVNHLNTQKRYVAIPQDIDLIARKLLLEDRLFNEGVCRPERFTTESQTTIYAIIEELEKKNVPISGWIERDAIRLSLPFDLQPQLTGLVQLEVMQDEGLRLRFGSPLHGLWFQKKKTKNEKIYSDSKGALGVQAQPQQRISVPQNPEKEIKSLCERLREIKNSLRLALVAESQIFENIDRPTEWTNAGVVARTKESWELFIKAMRNLFVEDMVHKLNDWTESRRYPDLNRELHSMRLRRNYIEHSESEEARKEDEKCCERDLGKRLASSADDWVCLQIGVLQRLEKALLTVVDVIGR